MGFFTRLFGGRKGPPANADRLADRIAMSLMNRALAAGRAGVAEPERKSTMRETVYLLNSVVFFVVVAHPRFDEHTGESFFENFLRHVEAYGRDAELWPVLNPPFLGLYYPDRLEEYVVPLGMGGAQDAESLRWGLDKGAELAVERLSREGSPPASLVEVLGDLAAQQFKETFDAFDRA